MSNNTPAVKCSSTKTENLAKCNIYKDAATMAMKDSTAYDTMLMESNEEYMERLSKADASEYEILKLNMLTATNPKERESIRKALTDMRKDRAVKDTEHKAYCKAMQKEHNDNNKKILYSIIVTLGLGGLGYYYRKPLLNASRKLVSSLG